MARVVAPPTYTIYLNEHRPRPLVALGGEALRGYRRRGVRDARDRRALGQGEQTRSGADAGRLHERPRIRGVHLQGFPREWRRRQDRPGLGRASRQGVLV